MPNYRHDIDGMRALAVVPVVLFHSDMPLISGGFVGVDVFFVISGFLITSILYDDIKKNSFSIIRFYERRTRRILPALLTVIFVSLCVGFVVLLPSAYVALSQSALSTLVFASNLWFWQASIDYFASPTDYMPLLHTWSLAVEEQFYIGFPLLLWLLSRWSRKLILASMALLTALSFLLATLVIDANPSAAFYLAPTRAWELGLGSLLALGQQNRRPAGWLLELVAIAGLGAILIPVFVYDGNTPFPGIAALLPCLGTAALIYAGAHGTPIITQALTFRPIVFVGLISYSLYLWHWPILAFLRSLFSTTHLSITVTFVAIFTSLVLAVFSWAYIEAPFRRTPPLGFQRSTIFKFAGTAIATLTVVTTSIALSSGWPSRFPIEVLSIAIAVESDGSNRQKCLNIRPKNGLCVFPNPEVDEASADILLWGDSHAEAILPGVELAARNAGLVGIFAGKSACPPLLNVNRIDRGPGHNCAGFNDAIRSYIEKQDNIQVVVLAARWALVAEGVRAANEEGGPAILAPAYTREQSTFIPEHNFEIFRRGITETVQFLRSTGRTVILIGNVPEIGWNVPTSLLSHIRWGTPLPASPVIESVTRRQKRAETVLYDLAMQPGVFFLPIASRMCNPVCQTLLEGESLYIDDDHLSSRGALKVIAPLLSETFKLIFPRERHIQ